MFVPDDDVVGPVDGGWTVARATLGNESVSIGGGQGGMSMPGAMMVTSFDAHPERLDRRRRPHRPLRRASSRRWACSTSAPRTAPSPERAPAPRARSPSSCCREIGHEAAAILTELSGPDAAFMDGAGGMSNLLVLMHRGMSIAGGTSEIKRNQIGERILGLPRDPLIK